MSAHPHHSKGFFAELRLMARRARQAWRLVPRRFKAALGGAVTITKHNAPKAVLISYAEFEALTRANVPALDELTDEFDTLRANRKLRRIGRNDLLIASIVRARRATLVTRNRRHFHQVPGLRVENWAD